MESILAIDTSADTCSVSLFSKGEWTNFHETLPRQHAKKVLGIVEEVMHAQHISLPQLDLIVYGQGPGSFTGLRIAAGVASGLSMALDIPVCGVSTLTALAMSQAHLSVGTYLLPCIDARMNQVYWCPHKLDAQGIPHPLSTEIVCDPSQVAINADWTPCKALGSGWEYCNDMPADLVRGIEILHTGLQPNAADMIRWVQATQPTLQQPGQVEPIYIRDNVTWNQQPKIGS